MAQLSELATEGLQVVQLLCGQEIAGRQDAAQSANFIYLVADTTTGKAAVFDACWEVDDVFDVADQLGVEITTAIYTHHHYDHAGGSMGRGRSLEGAKEMAEQGVEVLVATDDLAAVIKQCDVPSAKPLADGEVVTLGGSVGIRCIVTPGHTPGSACFAVGGDGSSLDDVEALITGDTLFVGAFGRVDLPTSDPDAMFESLSYLKGLNPQAVRETHNVFCDAILC
jgi:glyoxylase-like metal-dependent hydrolase (beta-lactamase superfamily II)